MVAKLRNVWERRKHEWRRELTLRASLSNATVKDLINNGVARARLDQPWISAKENEGVCGGFGIGREVCFRMLDRNQVLFIRTDMATFSCTATRKVTLRKHQASRQHQKSVLQELGVQVGPKGNPLVGALPFEVFSEVLAKLQSGMSAFKIDRGSTGDRLRNIRFCVLEAKQERGRGFMKRVATMVLFRDERRGRLLIRFAVLHYEV